MSASHGAVQILLRKLGNILATKYTLLHGIRGEIQELKDELESMTACLRDLADNDDHNEQTMTWMKQVREVAFDVEDCMDRFCHHLSRNHGDRHGLLEYLHRMFNMVRTLRVRHKVATDIQCLKSRAQKVSDRKLRYTYSLDDSAGRSGKALGTSYSHLGSLDRWLPAIHGDGPGLVGMGKMTDAVVGLLNEQRLATVGPRVLSMVGFGGVGKTTLATTVYNSPKLGGIQCRAFIPVSQTYDVRSLLESMLKQLLASAKKDKNDDPLKNIKDWDERDLFVKIKQHLADKRYLIILDDVWRAAAWDQLNVAIPRNNNQGSIIITTRSQEVAENCCTSSNIYKMNRLDKGDSEKLFFKTVFNPGQCPIDLLEVSKVILRRCNGLPLAIVSIGRMLARRQNQTPAEWQTVCNRLGSELETNPTLEGMRRILSLSYSDLPYHLKACFLYLCAFREDSEIRIGSLIRRWAAEGLIIGMYDRSLEEIAQIYLDEFVSRSIVIPEKFGCSGKIKSCKVHDMMLEVIIAKSVKENFISFLGSGQYNTTAGHDKVRRLFIHTGGTKEKITFPSKNIVHTRSLTILDSTVKPVPIKFSDLKLIRVLDLEGCRWLSDKNLKEICKLSLLRYLSLRNTAIPQLSNSVGKLKELVTLDVRETSVVEFPKGITQLQNLNHLLVGSYAYYTRTRSVKHFGWSEGAKVPLGLGNMGALQRISHADISTEKSSRAMRELGKLCQLTRLCVVNMKEAKFWKPFAESLDELSNSLRYLMVVDGSLEGEELEFLVRLKNPPLFLQSLHLKGRLTKLPDWVSSLNNLASLSLRETYHLTEASFKVLGKLPSLVSLKLYCWGYAGSALRFEEDMFLQLKQLVVDNLENLEKLSFRGGARNLERLTLAFLRVPSRGIHGIGKENLRHLREVEFFGVIVESIFDQVFEAAKEYPNHLKVTREDRPTTEAPQGPAQQVDNTGPGTGSSEQEPTDQQVDMPALRCEDEDDEATPAWRVPPSTCPHAYIL